jgi:anti-sigma factor RsiW
MSIETLLKIRDEEREAFEAYRMNISAMSKTVMSQGMSSAEGHEYFASQIAPSLEKLKREIALERKRQKTRVAVGVASIAAGVAIGAFGGLPVMASVPAAALGTAIGGKLLTKAVESRCEHGEDLRQNNDLFFLLRLVEEEQL